MAGSINSQHLYHDWVSMPAVLVTGALAVMQNTPFLSWSGHNHCQYSFCGWKDGQDVLAWVAWSDTKTVYLRTVTHLTINPAQCQVTLLLQLTTLPLG